MSLNAVFAIPGDMERRTGGFIYEATVLRELRALGHSVRHIELPAGFPDPSAEEAAQTLATLCTVPADRPILLDGFIPGTVDPAGLARVAAPIVPIIHHPLGLESGLSPGRAEFLLRNEAAALRHAARIVVPSRHTAGLLIDRFGLAPERIDIAPPGIALIARPAAPIAPPLILSVGLLATRKGHDVLLDALALLRDLDWQARIVGDTHDPAVAADLAARLDRHGLAERVRFTGLLSDADLARSYDGATLFALATRFEGYGLVFGDAMRRGLPIVTCHAGAVPDTVGDAAEIVPVDDPAAFATALRGLLVDAPARRALAARSAARGRTLPTWRDTARRIADTLIRVT